PDTRVLTEPPSPGRKKIIFRVGIFVTTLQVPTRSIFHFIHGSERETDRKRPMLCSFAVKVREGAYSPEVLVLEPEFPCVVFFLSAPCVASRTFDTIPL